MHSFISHWVYIPFAVDNGSVHPVILFRFKCWRHYSCPLLWHVTVTGMLLNFHWFSVAACHVCTPVCRASALLHNGPNELLSQNSTANDDRFGYHADDDSYHFADNVVEEQWHRDFMSGLVIILRQVAVNWASPKQIHRWQAGYVVKPRRNTACWSQLIRTLTFLMTLVRIEK
jgi:hypothetical protein